MRAPFNAGPVQPVRAGARAALAALMDLVGSAGLSAAATRPGLLATIDQHAAAVRDRLDGDLRPLTTVALAGYAEGIQSAAAEHDWQPPAAPQEWSAADWVLLRLLAVCSLAQELAQQGLPQPR